MLLAESPRLNLQLPEPLPVASQQSTEKKNLPECQKDDPKKRFRLPGSNYFRLKQFQIGKQRRKITRPVSAVHLFGKWHRPTSGMGFSKMLGTIWRNTHIPKIKRTFLPSNPACNLIFLLIERRHRGTLPRLLQPFWQILSYSQRPQQFFCPLRSRTGSHWPITIPVLPVSRKIRGSWVIKCICMYCICAIGRYLKVHRIPAYSKQGVR